ncbi:siderophore amonabactin TonB-dependent receptor [Halanaerocella petrolearia]
MKKLLLILAIVSVLNPIVIAKELETSFTLEEIVVTASKYSEKSSETAASVEVIDEEDIKQKNAHNVADLLRDIIGVQINDHGGLVGQKSISIRGSKSSQVLILIDGQPMNSSQNGGVDLGQFNTEQIERIEVMRGPSSAIYGANALGGVVNIITDSGSKETETSVKLGYGSFSTQKYNLNYSGSRDKLDYNLIMSKNKADGYRDNSELDQEYIFTRLDYKLNDYSDLILSVRYNDSEKGVPGKVTSPTPNAQQIDEDSNINLKWKRKTEKSDLKLTAYHNKHQQRYDDPDEFGYDGPSKHDTAKTGLNFNQTFYLKDHTLIYGTELKQNKIDSNENGEHENLNKALFIQDEWQVTKPLKVTLGSRYDDHEVFGAEVSPRAGVVYSINNKLNLHTSIGKAYKTPTFNDLYWPATTYTEGNPDLESETAVAYEMGSRYLDNKNEFSFNYFKRDVEDLIDWSPGKDGKYRPYNINSAKIKGIELNFTRQLIKSISTSLNYTYLDARNTISKERLDNKPYHTANFDIVYDNQEISTILNGRLIDGRPDNLPAYFVMDAKASKNITINNQELKVELEVNNLLNREYQVKAGYPMPERNYMLEVTKKF